jgi:hypothetical protein
MEESCEGGANMVGRMKGRRGEWESGRTLTDSQTRRLADSQTRRPTDSQTRRLKDTKTLLNQ